MKKIGSQIRASLRQEGYKLVSREGQNVILENEDGGHEIWTERDDFAGFVFEIDGVGYEFVSAI